MLPGLLPISPGALVNATLSAAVAGLVLCTVSFVDIRIIGNRKDRIIQKRKKKKRMDNFKENVLYYEMVAHYFMYTRA